MARPKKIAKETSELGVALDSSVVKEQYTPPSFHLRDTFGLYPHIKYIYKGDGFVNWRAMVNPEALYVNKLYFSRKKEPLPESIEDLNDDQLVIRQWGLRELMKLRGFLSTKIIPVASESTHVSCISEINWLGNYETDHHSVTTSDYANASIANCEEVVSIKFLEAIAANRALVRNIRNFLGIYVVGEEELDTNPSRIVANTEYNTQGSASIAKNENLGLKMGDSLKNLVYKESSINSFDDFMNFFHKSNAKLEIIKTHPSLLDEIENWTGFDSISTGSALAMIRAIEKQKEKRTKTV